PAAPWSWTGSLEMPSRSAEGLRSNISRMMASSSSRMSLVSSRAIALVLSLARLAGWGAAMSLPCLVLPGDDGGHVLGGHSVEVKMYLLGSAQRLPGAWQRPRTPLGQRPGAHRSHPVGQNGCRARDHQDHGHGGGQHYDQVADGRAPIRRLAVSCASCR